MGALLDCKNRRLLLPKQNEEMVVTNIGQTIIMEKSASRHLMIPVDSVSSVMCALETTADDAVDTICDE
eukprot:6464251-Amphidinium_carterae.1